MRIFALLILALFAGGAIYLSIYAERTINRNAKYGSDDLVRAIRIHNEKNKGRTPATQRDTRPENRQIIQYGGDVETVPNTGNMPTGNTYHGQDFVPETNEGQPGQPLPLTGTPPVNPVYK
jgi:hypothetical protein